jgi:PAS domain S-box-containing protein
MTKRKRNEKGTTMRDKDGGVRFYRALFKNALDFTSVLDAKGKFIFQSASIRAFLGYRENELKGENVFDYVHPDDLNEIKGAFLELVKKPGMVISREFRFRHKNGTYRWIESYGLNLLDNPDVRGIVVNSRDVDDRKRAENLLRESEAQLKNKEAFFRGVIENTREIFTIINDKGEMIFHSAAIEKIMGFKPEELTGQDVLKYVHPDDAWIFMDALRSVLEKPGNVATRQMRMRHRDGSWRWIESTGYNLLHEPAIRGIVINSRDITEQKELEHALMESEAKFRGLVEKSLVGVYIIQDGLFSYVNPELARIFGYTQSELIMKVPVLDLVAEEDRELVAQNIRRRIGGEVESLNYSFKGRKKDGTIFYVEVFGSRTEYQGKPAVIGTLLDVTERKRLQEQLFQSQKLEAIGRLAGGIAHDFNNLLTLIMLHSEMILKQLGETGDVSASIKEIYDSAQRASTLTSQLLSFARRQVIEPVMFNANTLIKGIGKMLKSLLGEHIEVEIIPAENLLPVKVDPAQLEHSIINLVINAKDAMPSGGKVIIETQNVYLDENYAKSHPEVVPGNYVLIAVSDTGTGMDESVRSRIFEPFFTTKKEGKGTGLGLASVYGFVKQSGGHIWVYSEVGKGTTFKIYLPAYREKTEEDGFKKKEEQKNLTGIETILLAEDEPSIRELIAKILALSGYRVIEAKDGIDALEKAEQFKGKIDLLLTDLVMPRLGGKDLYDRLKEHRPDTKVLFMSGYTDNVIVHNFILQDGVNFLQKPFRPQALLQKIRKVLEGK